MNENTVELGQEQVPVLEGTEAANVSLVPTDAPFEVCVQTEEEVGAEYAAPVAG